MNDRQRVEAGIIPALVYGVVYPLKDQQETDDEKERHSAIVNAAFNAVLDPGRDLELGRASQIYRRTEREYLALAAILDGASNAQAMMAVYYLLEGLLQEERLTIYEDSEFGKALQVYMEALDSHFAEEKLDAAAQKRARQLRDELKRQGYFR